jgi:hypothetical protein
MSIIRIVAVGVETEDKPSILNDAWHGSCSVSHDTVYKFDQ